MRRAPSTVALVPTVAALALLLHPGEARAYEDQLGLSLGAGYAAVASDNDLPHHGVALQLTGSLGIGDTWEVRALAAYGVHFGDGTLHRIAGGLELVYLVDILEIVPFFGLGADAPVSIWEAAGGTETWVDFAAHGVVGLDYLVSREWTIGAEVRPYVLLTSMSDQPTRPADPVWITAVVRAQMLFEI